MIFRTALKFLTIFVLILFYMAAASVVWLVPSLNSWKKRKACAWILHKMSRWGCWVLDLEVEARGPTDNTASESALITSNHLSYTDILLISAHTPTCFVTSLDIKRTPFLGQICMLAGCLFVDRKSRTNLPKEINEVTEGLKHGLNVTIFPEATSTNGEGVLRFRRPLFNAAIFAQVPVWPICINYQSIDGREVDVQTRDQVCWYGDMDFVTHLWKLCRAKQVKVSLELRPKIVSLGSSDQELAETAHQQVVSVFRSLGSSLQQVIEQSEDQPLSR